MPKNPKPQKPEHGTDQKDDKTAKPPYQEIADAYNSILPELPRVESVTASRAKNLGQRIEENLARKDPDWWKRYFFRVRDFPYPMGQNESGWRADFDWLISERGMQKIIEGSFLQRSSGTSDKIPARTKFGEELQKKYTDAEGHVDAWGILRELQELRAGVL